MDPNMSVAMQPPSYPMNINQQPSMGIPLQPGMPGTNTTTTVVIQQPGVQQLGPGAGRPWSSSLCSCFDDMSSCKLFCHTLINQGYERYSKFYHDL